MTSAAPLPEDFKLPLEMFYQWEQQQPHKTWLRQHDGLQWRDYSWSDVGVSARQLAAGLLAQGLEAGDKVGLYAENCAHWVIADMAIMMAGLVSVPIYTSMPEDKIRYVVDHSEMKLLLVGDQCALSVDEVEAAFSRQVKVLGIGYQSHHWQSLCEQAPALSGNPQREADDLWTIAYTSGTTGLPKGVMHSFCTLPSSVYDIRLLCDTNSESRYFSYLPLAHIAERSVVELHSLYSGGLIGFNRSKESFVEDLLEIRPTFFFSVPRIWANLKAGIVANMGEENWSRCIEEPEFGKATGEKVLASMGLGEVTLALTGSAPIPPSDIRAWRCLGMPLCEGFGQSESMSTAFNRKDNFKVGSIGLPITERAEMKISSEGELLLRSPGNMVGYFKEPEKTVETIVDGWLRTGDKARIDEDGFIFITGRVKDIFKTAKGKYVAPAPIENTFALFNGVEQCCLVGRGFPQTIMLAVLSEGIVRTEELHQALQVHLQNINKTLEAHERMSQVVLCAQPWSIENGLLTHTLKVLRDEVESHHADSLQKAMAADDSVYWETS
jgi:long-chain acyl-CoA synthetase